MRTGSALLALLLMAMCWACGNRIRAVRSPERSQDWREEWSHVADLDLRDDQRMSDEAVGCGSAVILIGVVETWTPLSPDPRRAAVRRNIRETYVK